MDVKFDYAPLDDIRLHYATAGTGERLVVLLHGFPEFWYSWRHQVAALADGYTVVAPDMRGYNRSDRPTKVSDYTIDKLVGDIVDLIGYLGHEKAAVIGHDWGASVAWALAAKRPDVVWKLGALQVPPIPVWKRNQTAAQYMASWYMFFFQLPVLPEALLRSGDHAKLVRALREHVPVGVFSDANIDEYKRAWSQPGAITAMLNYYRANIVRRLFGGSGVPAKIDLPTLFIYGEKDRAILPATVAGIADVVSGPYYEHRIPGAGHWVQHEAADEVTGVIRTFLNC